MEVKHIDLSKDSFTANGTEYFIRDTLTVERYTQFEKLQNHYAFGLQFKQIAERLERSIDLANKGKGIEAWNVIFNLKEGIAYRLEDREHPALLICSLFMVTDGEDLTKWDEQLAKRKIEDWKREGISINDFFQCASNFVSGFIKIYEEISRSIFQKEKATRKPSDKS